MLCCSIGVSLICANKEIYYYYYYYVEQFYERLTSYYNKIWPQLVDSIINFLSFIIRVDNVRNHTHIHPSELFTERGNDKR